MERPILFSAPMVRALLEGRKTETRRIVKPQPPSIEDVTKKAGIGYSWLPPETYGGAPGGSLFRVGGPIWAVRELMGLGVDDTPMLKCPYGRRGDRLWVKETFAHVDDHESHGPGCVVYRADPPHPTDHVERWTSPLFMPRALARLSLLITEVRVERLQELTDADAMAEGTGGRAGFAALWESLNAASAPWASNPWVWVVRFERLGAQARRSA